ncbi:MAG: hypothetical protein QNJ73_02615 [Gammaproteobacteria bacterium]|nr:hypothetical protein [Gammaproteobacteria bacterium]
MISTARVKSPAGMPEAFNAPLFRKAVEQLDQERRCVVLDLGAAHTDTIALFSEYRCRLEIADIADGLGSLAEITDDLEQRAEALLPRAQQEPADLVLCWDLLNYLSLPAIRALSKRLSARGRPGMQLHCLIVYAATNMPVTPCPFIPQPDRSLLQLAADPNEIQAPRYSPEALGDALLGYTVDRAMLLGNGMQEFLFRL